MIPRTRRDPDPAALAAKDPLLDRLRAGDETSFAELVRSTSPRLLATLRRMLRSEDDARDALQETFLAAFRAFETFEGQAQLSTWLHRIAINAALMKLRSRRRHPEESIEDLLPRFDADGCHVPERGPVGAEAALDAEQQRALVRRCIDRLHETHRSVILLRDIEGLGTEEAARALGISPDAAKMRLHRAHQALRTLLVREGALAASSDGGPRGGSRRGRYRSGDRDGASGPRPPLDAFETAGPRQRRAAPDLPHRPQLVALLQAADAERVRRGVARRGRVDRRAAVGAERVDALVPAVRRLHVGPRLAGE